MMIICVVGTIASGKGTVARLVKKQGYVHHSTSLTIRAIARERDIGIDREHLSKLGAELRKESPDVSLIMARIIEHIRKEIKKDPQLNFVIEGLRDMQEYEDLVALEKEVGKTMLIGVTADPQVRFERLKHRGREGDPETFEEFEKIDAAEYAVGGGQEVQLLMEAADVIIDNSGTPDELEIEVKKILGVIKD